MPLTKRSLRRFPFPLLPRRPCRRPPLSACVIRLGKELELKVSTCPIIIIPSRPFLLLLRLLSELRPLVDIPPVSLPRTRLLPTGRARITQCAVDRHKIYFRHKLRLSLPRLTLSLAKSRCIIPMQYAFYGTVPTLLASTTQHHGESERIAFCAVL